MGPFFALGKTIGVPMWVVQRLWMALLLTVALWGALRAAEALRIGTPTTRLLGAAVYALSPPMTSLVTSASGGQIPMALLPWILLPLITGANGGSTPPGRCPVWNRRLCHGSRERDVHDRGAAAPRALAHHAAARGASGIAHPMVAPVHPSRLRVVGRPSSAPGSLRLRLRSVHGAPRSLLRPHLRSRCSAAPGIGSYFPTKEDVLLRDYVDMDDSLLVALMARPDEEKPWVAIRRALDPLIDQYSAHPERTLRSAKLFIKTPTLVTFHREKLARWGQFLRPELARRLGADPDDPTDPRATALITAALACLDATLAAWATADGVPHLAQLLDRAMNAID